jgi:hypothetical protein
MGDATWERKVLNRFPERKNEEYILEEALIYLEA